MSWNGFSDESADGNEASVHEGSVGRSDPTTSGSDAHFESHDANGDPDIIHSSESHGIRHERPSTSHPETNMETGQSMGRIH